MWGWLYFRNHGNVKTKPWGILSLWYWLCKQRMTLLDNWYCYACRTKCWPGSLSTAMLSITQMPLPRTKKMKMKTNNRWECQLSNSILFSGGRIVSCTRPFANVTPHMYITRSAMASHDTKKPVNNVYTSFFKLLIRPKKLGNWSNTSAKLLKTLVNRTRAKPLVQLRDFAYK